MKLILSLLISVVCASKLRFDGDQVLTLFPQTQGHLKVIQEFGQVTGLVDFWYPDSADSVQVGHPVDIRVPRHFLKGILSKIEKSGLFYQTKISNVQELVENQHNSKRSGKSEGYDYYKYHTYEEIVQWSRDISNAFPKLARWEELAFSTEGRLIPKLTLGSSTDKPEFIIDCGIHAREWIAPAFCQYFVHRMLTEYASDPQVGRMMDEMTWVIIPLLNVDGYDYTWTDNRLWRKTRSLNPGSLCVGTDANRNYDVSWSGPGASPDPCSQTYHGPSVESEPEVKASADLIRKHSDTAKAYVAFHSYTQVFVYPFSYSNVSTSNAEQLDDLSERAAQAILDTTGMKYTYGPGTTSMYGVSGGAKDFTWLQGIPLSWTIELRDTGEFGFLLPEEQIPDNCREMFEAMKVITEEAITTTIDV